VDHGGRDAYYWSDTLWCLDGESSGGGLVLVRDLASLDDVDEAMKVLFVMWAWWFIIVYGGGYSGRAIEVVGPFGNESSCMAAQVLAKKLAYKVTPCWVDR